LTNGSLCGDSQVRGGRKRVRGTSEERKKRGIGSAEDIAGIRIQDFKISGGGTKTAADKTLCGEENTAQSNWPLDVMVMSCSTLGGGKGDSKFLSLEGRKEEEMTLGIAKKSVITCRGGRNRKNHRVIQRKLEKKG